MENGGNATTYDSLPIGVTFATAKCRWPENFVKVYAAYWFSRLHSLHGSKISICPSLGGTNNVVILTMYEEDS